MAQPIPTDQNAAARLAGLLDSAMDGIITVDDAQRIVLYNRAAEKIFGWPRAQVLGQPLDMLIPARFRGGHAPAGAPLRRHRHHLAPHGRQHGAVRRCARDGEEFPIDASISQLETPEGKLYTVILRDVTERVRAQRGAGGASPPRRPACASRRSRASRANCTTSWRSRSPR